VAELVLGSLPNFLGQWLTVLSGKHLKIAHLMQKLSVAIQRFVLRIV